MTVAELFEEMLNNLKISNADDIRNRRDEITKALNKEFRDSESETSNRLMVGSWGRFTAINGISDLDLLYILPSSLYDDYHKKDGCSKALTRVKNAISSHYSRSDIKVDRLVVVVQFSDYKFEVQPVFKNEDGSYQYPDTYKDQWKVTKPQDEIDEISQLDADASGNARKICKYARAWKNKHDVEMNGLLIDTMVWKFLNETENYHTESAEQDKMMRDFFEYLKDLPKQESWNALGSNQKIWVKKQFKGDASEAYDLCCKAIDAEGKSTMQEKWRAVFGKCVPLPASNQQSVNLIRYKDTEEFIQDLYPLRLEYELRIDCTVTQDGFRPATLRDMIRHHKLLRVNKKLEFKIISTNVPEPFDVRWKVLNRGEEAMRRDQVRGQIIQSTSGRARVEHTSFRGEHYVECYIIKNGFVVAQDHIAVPIRID